MSYPVATVTAVAATISSTDAPRLRSQTGLRKPCKKGTGLRKPCKKGPNAWAEASSWHSLYPIFPAFKSGKTSTLKSPDCTPFLAAMAWFNAASAWIGPKLSMPRSASALAAPRVRSTECPWPDSPVEYDNSATRGAPSSPCADAAR